MKYTLPDQQKERDRILFTLKTQGTPQDLVEYACKHHLDLSLLRNVVQPPAVALTIKQPWAWAIVSGLKDVENRTWATPHRGALQGVSKLQVAEQMGLDEAVFAIACELFRMGEDENDDN